MRLHVWILLFGVVIVLLLGLVEGGTRKNNNNHLKRRKDSKEAGELQSVGNGGLDSEFVVVVVVFIEADFVKISKTF